MHNTIAGRDRDQRNSTGRAVSSLLGNNRRGLRDADRVRILRRASLDDTDLIQQLCDGTDPTRWLADPRNILLLDGANCLMFLWRWVGIYELHIQFTATGREAERICRSMLAAVPAAMLLAVIPKEKRNVRLFARRMGFEARGEIETIEGLCEMYQLEAARELH